MQSFSRVTSGLLSAQIGLYTTGHNISNAATEGYTRQRANFSDSSYTTIGFNGSGALKLGLGSKLTSITQLRDELLDKTYRKAVSKASFHGVKDNAITEIETILGELYGDSRLSDSIDDLWKSLQELVTHPDGYETRAAFVSSSVMFVNKVSNISNQLYEYQMTINNEVIKSVNRINEITTQINDLNKMITLNEASGDNANDYRDIRNNLIDELAYYGEISVKEEYNGSVTILMEGKDLVANGRANILGLEYTSANCPFVKPVFNAAYVKDGVILPAGTNARELFTNLDKTKMGGKYDNDNGSLKSLMLVRGNFIANYTSDPESVNNYTIPKFQKEMDMLVNKLVTLINDMLAPPVDHDPTAVYEGAPYDLDGNQFIELFSRKNISRYDSNGDFIEEDPNTPYTLYSMSNIMINPDVLNNFNKLCLSANEVDRADTTVIEKILSYWTGGAGDDKYMPKFEETSTPMSFSDYYSQMITRLGEEGATSKTYMDAQNIIVNDTIAARQSISGVSLDEELTEMMKFQHAYDAAARMVNVIDSMLDLLVNRLKV